MHWITLKGERVEKGLEWKDNETRRLIKVMKGNSKWEMGRWSVSRGGKGEGEKERSREREKLDSFWFSHFLSLIIPHNNQVTGRSNFEFIQGFCLLQRSNVSNEFDSVAQKECSFGIVLQLGKEWKERALADVFGNIWTKTKGRDQNQKAILSNGKSIDAGSVSASHFGFSIPNHGNSVHFEPRSGVRGDSDEGTRLHKVIYQSTVWIPGSCLLSFFSLWSSSALMLVQGTIKEIAFDSNSFSSQKGQENHRFPSHVSAVSFKS